MTTGISAASIMQADRAEITRLLGELADRKGSAAAELLPLVYDELRALAAGFFQGQGWAHTLQPTALVHEAYLRLAAQESPDWSGRDHFFAVAAKAMRQVLVDHARRKRAEKRGGGAGRGEAGAGLAWQRITLDEAVSASVGREVDFADLEDAIGRLAALDDRKAEVVTLRFFGGLSNEAVAAALGVSRKTVVEDWAVARAWLGRELRRMSGA
jgi:RNA polymerase sigma factor (TIGR02999 family)